MLMFALAAASQYSWTRDHAQRCRERQLIRVLFRSSFAKSFSVSNDDAESVLRSARFNRVLTRTRGRLCEYLKRPSTVRIVIIARRWSHSIGLPAASENNSKSPNDSSINPHNQVIKKWKIILCVCLNCRKKKKKREGEKREPNENFVSKEMKTL